MNICLSSALAFSAISVFAARNSLAQPRFEVASVKHADRCSMENTVDPGMIALNGDPLKVILMEAFRVKTDQIVGPSWLDSECFTINAKMPNAGMPAGATGDQLPAMLQALLAERFKMTVHRESRPQPGYALVVDKSGAKLKASDPNSSDAGARTGRVQFGATLQSSGIKGSMTLATLTRLLSARLASPVEDLTGLQGKYDVDISWALDPAFERPGAYARAYAQEHPNAEPPSAPTPEGDLFTAVRESLGLRLEPHREQVEMVVIDSIERVPAEN